MEAFFTQEYALVWMVVLALALYLPVRRLIWVIFVRRAQREGEPDEAERQRLKRRAGFSAALISFIFAYFYVSHLFRDPL